MSLLSRLPRAVPPRLPLQLRVLRSDIGAASPTSSSTIVSRQFGSITSRMADRVHRVTMFKVPKEEHRKELIGLYEILKAENSKDGKPYILSMAAGPAEPDARSQGYTFVSKTEFASMADMKYYDEECPAHQKVKDGLKATGGVEGIMTVYFTPKVTGGAAVSA